MRLNNKLTVLLAVWGLLFAACTNDKITDRVPDKPTHPNTMSTRYSGCDIQNLQLFRLTYHSSENDAGVLDMTVYTYA